MAIWYEWTGQTAATTATTAIWNVWLTGTTASASTPANTVWYQWANTTTANCTTPIAGAYVPVRVSEEELVRRQAANAEQAERNRKAAEEAERLRLAADRRAEELLHKHLNGRQRRQYRRSKSFIVTGKDGHNYKVKRAWAGHVSRLNARGREVERFCIHPHVDVPLPDNQLIAKLMLETDPERFKAIANASPIVAAA